MNYATGCIFEYDDTHLQESGIGFKESDKPNFTCSFYSTNKAMVYLEQQVPFLTSLHMYIMLLSVFCMKVEELLIEFDNAHID